MLGFLRMAVLAAIFAFVASPAAAQSYQNEALDDATQAYAQQLQANAANLDSPAATLRALAQAAAARGDANAAMGLHEQIAGLEPQNARAFIDLSQAILALPLEDETARHDLMRKAGQAAWRAYSLAPDAATKAEALALVSRAFAAIQDWRPALDSLKASLALQESPPIRALYTEMRARHGFRVLNFTADSEPAAPRACFQFSENLPGKRIDLTPYVSVAEIERPAVSVEEAQLCVEGLRHGERYSVTLREGLPSAIGESLLKSAAFNIYVRDRSPAVRFTSKSWVLPRTGQKGIPIVSINTDRIAAEIYRIGDRNLMATVLEGDFERPLYAYDLDRLANERGARVWEGEMKVAFRLNEEVVTALPVAETVGELKPGIYALVARPAPVRADDYGEIATQWFIVSDLGLSALSGADGIYAQVNSLATAEGLEGVQITLLSRSNEELGRSTTGAFGVAHFAAGLTRGQGGLSPAMLVARGADGDYAFLNLKDAAFDLSDRGVSGRIAPGPLDAFVVTERGVYRTGETVHVTALLRAADTKAASAPMTLVVARPDGVEHRRALLADRGLGGRSLSMPIPAGALTGTWRVRAYADPKAAPIGETAFLVEDYMPDRIEFDLEPKAQVMTRSGATEIAVDGRYLYGAPAAGLALEGEVTLQPAPHRPGYDGYRFGFPADAAGAEIIPLEDLPKTDANGKALLSIGLSQIPDATQPLEAKIAIRMAEPGGRAVERSITLPVAADAETIGIKPLFEGRSLADGATAEFDIIAVSPGGDEVLRKNLRWDLYRLETHYQWYRQHGSWNYEPVKLTRRVANGTIDVAPGQPGRIAHNVGWGTYRLDVAAEGEPALLSSVEFDAGWQAEATAETPDLLELALDKSGYSPGEMLTASVSARSAGRLTIDIVSESVLGSKTLDIPAGETQVEIVVGEDWGPGAYVLATLLRPLDAEAKRIPGRAIGAQWFSVGRKAHNLPLALDLPRKIRPGEPLRIPVRIDGLQPGEEARVVVAAVDVGILNLTNYQSPKPDDYYLGQRRLGVELRDLYGQLIDGMQAARGEIVTGGDGGAVELAGSPPAQAPLALYSGIVAIEPDGTAEVAFEMPDFTGAIRVMAFAWSENRLGSAEGEIVVRDPVVLTASLPRFLTQGDESTIRIDLDNVEGAAGEYRVTLTETGAAQIGDGVTKVLRLDEKARAGFGVPVSAEGVGEAAITVAVAGPDGYTAERSFALNVQPANQLIARRSVHTLGKGQTLTLSEDVFTGLEPGTGSVALSIAPSVAIDPFALSAALQSYPFGCSEQITSEAIALLSLKQLASAHPQAPQQDHAARIQAIIGLLLARQGSDGSFGLWSAGGADAWLDAYVTDFLTRARENGFEVADHAFAQAIDRLRNFVNIAPDPSVDGGESLAYALYVLARNGAAPVGDLRYLADARLGDIATPMAKAQVAAALAMLGDKQRAATVFAAALGGLAPSAELDRVRRDYGSELRDAAAVLTLAAESGDDGLLQQAALRIDEARDTRPTTSTQENAWLILAASALEERGGETTIDVSGTAQQAPYHTTLTAANLAAPFVAGNSSGETLQAVVTVRGRPKAPEPPSANGFTIERGYYTLEGDPADPSQAQQNQRFVVVLSITGQNPQFSHLAVTDRLPAGFEIDNPRLVSSGDATALPWILNRAQASHTEFRDDRFFAAFERQVNDSSFSVAYVVRAVTPGRYVLPQASVEDMYRPERFARTGSGVVEISGR